MMRRILMPIVAVLAMLGVMGAPALAQAGGGEHVYTAPHHLFALPIPKAPNFAGLPYAVTPLDPLDDPQYDKVMLHVDDFGQFLVAGVRLLPPPAIEAMNQDPPRVVLGNVAQAILMGWRQDLPEPPAAEQTSWIETPFGETLVRVYRAEKGSFLRKAQGRRPTAADAFDTDIVAVVARQGALIVFAVAQNDAVPDDGAATTRMATELFHSIKVLTDRR